MATPSQTDRPATLADVFGDALDNLSHLPGVIGELADVVRQFASGIAPLVSALTSLFAVSATSAVAAAAVPRPPAAAPAAPAVTTTTTTTTTVGATAGAAVWGVLVRSVDRAALAVARLSVVMERALGPVGLAGPGAIPAIGSTGGPGAPANPRIPAALGRVVAPVTGLVPGSTAPAGPGAIPAGAWWGGAGASASAAAASTTTTTTTVGGAPPAPPGGAAKAVPVAPPPGGGGLAQLAAAGAVAAAAIGALAAVAHVAGQKFAQLEQSVRLFNPGVIQTFHHALANLGATVGRAFVPVFQNATEVVRQWAGVLAPIASQLAPVVKAVSDAMANTLVRVLTQLGAVIRAGLPGLAALMEVFALGAEAGAALFNTLGQLFRSVMLVARVFYELSGLGTVVRVLTKLFEALNVVLRVLDEALSIVEVVVTSLVDSLMAWVGSLLPFGDVMNSLSKAVEYVIRSMYVWAVHLAKMIGAMGVVDALISHVEGKTKAGDVAAQQPQIKSLEQLSKDLALAAASAGGAAGQGGVKNQQEFWQKTLDEMRAAKANGMTIQQLVEAILGEVRKLVPSLPGTPAAPPPSVPRGPGGLPLGPVHRHPDAQLTPRSDIWGRVGGLLGAG